MSDQESVLLEGTLRLRRFYKDIKPLHDAEDKLIAELDRDLDDVCSRLEIPGHGRWRVWKFRKALDRELGLR